MTTIRKLNYKFRTPDHRDYKYVPKQNIKIAKSSYTIQPKISQILDQGNLGSCVANAFSQYIRIMTAYKLQPSRILFYYIGRLTGSLYITEDTGLDIRMACSVMKDYGVCQESVCPYNINNFANTPSLNSFQASKLFKKYSYSFVTQDLIHIKSALTLNTPIIFGFQVYSSFMSRSVASNGIVPMPATNPITGIISEMPQGGHCVLLIGFSDTTQMFTCLNSWGQSWGNKGLFYMPYAYILNTELTSDLCVLNFIY